MKTDIPSIGEKRDAESPSADVTFDALGHRYRRYVLHHLGARTGAPTVDELADRIAFWEGEATDERRERVAVALYHCHLPRLVEAGVVRYAPDDGTVELLDRAESLTPYLVLAASTGLS